MKCSSWTVNRENGRWYFWELFTCWSVFYSSLHHISWSPTYFPLFPQSHGRHDISETIPHQLTPCFREKARKCCPIQSPRVVPCDFKSGHRCTNILYVIANILLMLTRDIIFIFWEFVEWFPFACCVFGQQLKRVEDLMSLQHLWMWLGTVPRQKVWAWRESLEAAGSAFNNASFNICCWVGLMSSFWFMILSHVAMKMDRDTSKSCQKYCQQFD